jgi:hypothetical protein
MRPALLLSATALLLSLGCGSSGPGPTGPNTPGNPSNPDPNPGQPGSYLISIGSRSLQGTVGVSTSWQPSGGRIYLGAAPLTQAAIGTLTLQIGPIITRSDGTQYADLLGGTVSSSLRASGTVEQLHALSYVVSPTSAGIDSIRVGSTFIEGVPRFRVTSIPTQVDPVAETVDVRGHFRAVNGNP